MMLLKGLFIFMWTVHQVTPIPKIYVRMSALTSIPVVPLAIPAGVGNAQSLPPSDTTGTHIVSVFSIIQCAVIAMVVDSALGYAFEDNVCAIFGLGYATGVKQTTFYMITSSTSLWAEVTQNRVTYSCGHWGNWDKDKAIDGIPLYGYQYHSNTSVERPWWLLDISQSMRIHEVKVCPQKEGNFQRFHDIEIRIGTVLRQDGDFSSYTEFGFYAGPYAGPEEGDFVFLDMQGIVGQYISIQIITSGSSILELTEVYVKAANI